MKLLMVTVDWASQGGGGITRFSKGLAQGLVHNSVDVEVLVEKNGPNSQKSPVEENGLIIHEVAYGGSPLKRALLFALKIWFLTSKQKYDAIVAITWSPCGTAAFLCRLISNIPFWVVCHGNDIIEPQRSRFYTWLMKKVLRKAKGILPNSNFTASLVIDLGIKKDKINVIGCGINPDDLKISEDQESIKEKFNSGPGILICTIGRLVPRKGQDMIIKAMPAILREFPESVYMIVGEGDDKPRLVQLTKELGVDKNVIFTGFLSDSETYQCVLECDIFAMVSRDIKEEGEVEGFGIVFLEAAYFRKPVVAGRAGGMADAVIDGETGLLADPENPDDIAQKIITLISNKKLCDNMGQKGYERVLGEFTWNAVAKRVLIEYSQT